MKKFQILEVGEKWVERTFSNQILCYAKSATLKNTKTEKPKKTKYWDKIEKLPLKAYNKNERNSRKNSWIMLGIDAPLRVNWLAAGND